MKEKTQHSSWKEHFKSHMMTVVSEITALSSIISEASSFSLSLNFSNSEITWNMKLSFHYSRFQQLHICNMVESLFIARNYFWARNFGRNKKKTEKYFLVFFFLEIFILFQTIWEAILCKCFAFCIAHDNPEIFTDFWQVCQELTCLTYLSK